MQHTSIWQNEPLLDLEGNHFVRLENYQSILELTDCLVRLKMKGMYMRSVTKHTDSQCNKAGNFCRRHY